MPAGINTWEVQADLEAAKRVRIPWGAVGAFVAHVEAGQRHEIITEAEWSFAKFRGDRVLFIDWERLVAAPWAGSSWAATGVTWGLMQPMQSPGSTSGTP